MNMWFLGLFVAVPSLSSTLTWPWFDSLPSVRHNGFMPVSANVSIDVVTERLRSFGVSHPEIQALFVFGSLARGTMREGSDVDTAVLLCREVDDAEALKLSLSYCAGIEDRLKAPADVVILNSASPILRLQIFRKGKMVYTTNANRTRKFIGDALVEFYDEIVMLEKIQNRMIRRLIGR